MGLLCSVNVFPSHRGKGISNVIYHAIDSWLIHGVSRSDDTSRRRHFSSVHVACSAPETIYLSQKHGYELIADFKYDQESRLIEQFAGCSLAEAMPGIENADMLKRHRGELPKIEYYVKEGQ